MTISARTRASKRHRSAWGHGLIVSQWMYRLWCKIQNYQPDILLRHFTSLVAKGWSIRSQNIPLESSGFLRKAPDFKEAPRGVNGIPRLVPASGFRERILPCHPNPLNLFFYYASSAIIWISILLPKQLRHFSFVLHGINKNGITCVLSRIWHVSASMLRWCDIQTYGTWNNAEDLKYIVFTKIIKTTRESM